ncbi:hypothetical protein M440DRAFT_1090853 [Trichoderma longibrachiatum ATCC 18648]|uniref:Uncharacterized protein n=1 Tax=Trichoderma longibrachiatum ATCC 18648 TaxID=983965 RepID=A0A2T4BT68_TRILO|nr:hypothetical protein M440DRAFT_1090853 [Trichoderma longibrachiatum ATCC 18648]
MLSPPRKRQSHARWDSAAPRVLFLYHRPAAARNGMDEKFPAGSSPCPLPSYAAGTPYQHVASRGWSTGARARPCCRQTRSPESCCHGGLLGEREVQVPSDDDSVVHLAAIESTSMAAGIAVDPVAARQNTPMSALPGILHITYRNRPLKRRAQHPF